MYCRIIVLIFKIYEGQPDTPHILKTKDHVAGSRIVDILLVHTLPPTAILNTVLPGVKVGFLIDEVDNNPSEVPHEKANIFHMRNQRRSSASQ